MYEWLKTTCLIEVTVIFHVGNVKNYVSDREKWGFSCK